MEIHQLNLPSGVVIFTSKGDRLEKVEALLNDLSYYYSTEIDNDIDTFKERSPKIYKYLTNSL